MATHKKEEPEKPKPNTAVVYVPNTDQGNPLPCEPLHFTEGKHDVKAIRWVSPQMLTVQMEDGQIMTFANIPFQFNSYPQPPVKKEARL